MKTNEELQAVAILAAELAAPMEFDRYRDIDSLEKEYVRKRLAEIDTLSADDAALMSLILDRFGPNSLLRLSRLDWSLASEISTESNVFAKEFKKNQKLTCNCGTVFRASDIENFHGDKKFHNVWRRDNQCVVCNKVALDLVYKPCPTCGMYVRQGLASYKSDPECNRHRPIDIEYESKRAALARYRARGLNLEASLTAEEWLAILEAFDRSCAYCREKPLQHLEHLRSTTAGGGSTAQNCLPACARCNLRKRSRLPEEIDEVFGSGTLERVTTTLLGVKHAPKPKRKPPERQLDPETERLFAEFMAAHPYVPPAPPFDALLTKKP